MEEVADAWRAAGMDVVACMRRATEVTGEWVYDAAALGEYRDRLKPKFNSEHTVPVKARKLSEILDPQPQASVVIRKLLDWIDRVDIASQCGRSRPPFATPSGGAIFPEDDDPWWLTELSRRSREEPPPPGDEDGPAASEEEGPAEDALTDDEDPLSEAGEDVASDADMPDICGSQPTVPGDHVAEIAWPSSSVSSAAAPNKARVIGGDGGGSRKAQNFDDEDPEFQRALYADIQLPYADQALWRIFCHAAAAAGSLEGLLVRVEQERRLEVAESDFVQKIRSLSSSLPWKYIYAMQNQAKDPAYKDIWAQWVEAAQYKIEGRIDGDA